MRPNPHVPKLYSHQVREELERRDPIVQHATKVLHPKPQDTSDA